MGKVEKIPAAISEAWLLARIREVCHPSSGIMFGSLGKSFEGREIPFLRFGTGEKRYLYVGGHHGMEWVTSVALLLFLEELARVGNLLGVDVAYMRETRSLTVVPLLNVDGAYLQSGSLPAEADGRRAEKIRMNGGEDFSHWQANGRGVDLNHNYNAGFSEYKKMEASLGIVGGCAGKYSGAFPESEPEVESLASLVRREKPRLILTLHTQGEEIYAPAALEETPRGRSILRGAVALSGYRYSKPTGTGLYGGLSDWAVSALGIPSLTLECGKGENPLPYTSAFYIYQKLRKLLLFALTW